MNVQIMSGPMNGGQHAPGRVLGVAGTDDYGSPMLVVDMDAPGSFVVVTYPGMHVPDDAAYVGHVPNPHNPAMLPMLVFASPA